MMRTYTVGTIDSESLMVRTQERLTGTQAGERRVILENGEHIASLSIHDAQELSLYLVKAVNFLTRDQP